MSAAATPRFASRRQMLNAQAALLALRLTRAWNHVAAHLLAMPDVVLAEVHRGQFESRPPSARQLAFACRQRCLRLEESAAGAAGVADLDTRPCDALAAFAATDMHRRGKTHALIVSMNVVAAAVAALAEQNTRARSQQASVASMDELRRQKAS